MQCGHPPLALRLRGELHRLGVGDLLGVEPGQQAVGLSPGIRGGLAGDSAGSNGERVAQLERLAVLHDLGSLTDAEFAAQKAVLMNGVTL